MFNFDNILFSVTISGGRANVHVRENIVGIGAQKKSGIIGSQVGVEEPSLSKYTTALQLGALKRHKVSERLIRTSRFELWPQPFIY